jgi:FAD/FMN-containing dehydrogenase
VRNIYDKKTVFSSIAEEETMSTPANAAGRQALDANTIQSFEDQLNGEVIRPDDERYDEARAVWNGIIDRHPVLIVRCASAQDVVAAVNFARENDVPLSVRGGGHNVAGSSVCDGCLVVDLSLMKEVRVDPESKIVRAAGGATIGDLDRATQAHGLAAPMGVVTATGIAGLTLGGGYGWLRNKYGLSCDNLIAAEVVTAEGRIIRASRTENSDLLWGLRGGGGNFGIVTEFEYRVYAVGPEVMFVFVFHDGEGDNMKKGLQFYRDYTQSAPDEVSTLAFLGRVPPDPELAPAEIHRRPYVAYGGMYAGPPAEGEKLLQPLRDFGEPLMDMSGIMPYLEAQQMFDLDYPDGMRYYWKSLSLMKLDDEAIERIVSHARQQPSVLSTTDLWHVGGAVKRVSPEESALGGRQAAFMLNLEANWERPEDDEANIRWARSLLDDMRPYSDGSRYLNFAGFLEEGDDMMRGAFGAKYQRLAELKKKHDPTNFFSRNQNIKPAS